MSNKMNIDYFEKLWDDSDCQLETEYNYQTPIQKPNTTKEFKNTLGENKGGLKSFADWIGQAQIESIPNSSESFEEEIECVNHEAPEVKSWMSSKAMMNINPRLSIQENMRRISSKDILLKILK